MKIALNLTRESVGGIGVSSINLINFLYSQDYQFLGIELNPLRYMKGAVCFRNFAPEVFDHNIINIHDLPIMKVVKRSKNLKDVINKYKETIDIIRGILKKEKPDIVLLSGTYYVPWLISVAAHREKIPCVLWYSGVLFKETEHQSEKVKNIFLSMEKSIIRNSNRIIFPSKICRDLVEEKIIKGKIKKSHIIPNPVANNFIDPCAVEYSVERRIAAVGRYVKIKNFDVFFNIHKNLLEKNWQHSASFVTNHNFKTNNFPSTIDILPPMDSDGLKKFYVSQGLIICPSKFETFGNVPMEAVCLGIPVLVSDKMGCSEILKRVGLENMVISFDNLDKVVERVQQLCGQSILPKQINALKKILDNRFVSQEIRAVLKDVLNNNFKNI